MHSRVVVLLALCTCPLLACGGPSAGPDAFTPGPDAADPAVDAFTAPGEDAFTPSGEDAPASGDVARCQSIAAMVATACAGQADRTCEHTQGAMRCATERADVLADAYQCLLDASTGTGSCRTFSDPSAARDCLVALAGATDTTPVDALVDRIADLCKLSDTTPILATNIIPFMALSPATAGRLEACATAAMNCDALSACYTTEFSAIAACYE